MTSPGLDVWEFAVEIRILLEVGLSLTNLRWLIFQGYVNHARERTRETDRQRQFCRVRNLACYSDTCFVLTLKGLELFRSGAVTLHASAADRKPHWDGQRRKLVWGESVIKEFRLPADNQEAILSALEEEGWPSRIDDPLPQTGEQEPKVRLHDAIKGLNRRQRHRLIRFRGDGTGHGILWEPIASCALEAPPGLPQTSP